MVKIKNKRLLALVIDGGGLFWSFVSSAAACCQENLAMHGNLATLKNQHSPLLSF